MNSLVQDQQHALSSGLASGVENQSRVSLSDKLRKTWAALRLWRQRARERHQLAKLPPYILKDIGLTEADRYQETRKHFWEG